MGYIALVIKDKLAGGIDPVYDMVRTEADSQEEAVQLIANHEWPEEYYIGRSITRVVQIHEESDWNPRKCATPQVKAAQGKERRPGGPRVRKRKAGS